MKWPCGTRTSTDNRRIFAWVLAMLKSNWYELQTKYSVIERLMATKGLEVVPLLIVIEVGGLSKKIALLKATLEASTSDMVVISCKWKGKCNIKRCWCFKEQKRCSVHCHSGVDDHDCWALVSLALRTYREAIGVTKTGLSIYSTRYIWRWGWIMVQIRRLGAISFWKSLTPNWTPSTSH